jgi:hypothetical protein
VGSLAAAQAVTNTYTPDLNGRTDVSTVLSTSAPGKTERTEISSSINGRQVPLQQTEERVLSQDANRKVVETTVRKYNPQGELISTERVLTDEHKLAGGGSEVHATTYRSDLNGQMREAQRSTAETHLQGAQAQTETVIETPTVNGSFQATEKRSLVSETSNGATHSDETVYRRSDNGDYYPALRQVTEEKQEGDKTTTHAAFYEPGLSGDLQLARQTVTDTTKRPDGSEVTEVNLYARSIPGVVQSGGAPEQLQEQQLISRAKGPGDTVVETVSIRRPTISDPALLGSLQKLSETVCKGKCTDK